MLIRRYGLLTSRARVARPAFFLSLSLSLSLSLKQIEYLFNELFIQYQHQFISLEK